MHFVCTVFSVHSVNPGRAWYPFLFIASESVHVVSLQAQKAQGQSAPANRAFPTKTTTPGPPEYEAKDISVRVMSPQSVLISWVDPAVEMGKVAPGASRSYTVRYREKGESARWEYKDGAQRRMMIDTLSADSMYEFSVRISQEENHGKWSVSVFQRTPESAPSGPPENFEVKPLRGKGTAVVATWDPPEEPNGRIREYILSYAPAMKPFGMKSVTYRGSTTTATVDGLTPGDRYIFKIRATNRRGMGPQSKAFSVAMPGCNHTPSKQDTDHEESNFQSTKMPEEPTTTPQPRPAAPNSRRTRPLSQTRSYHSIFSSVRGSVRNGMNRGSSRGRSREDEEEEEEVPTTPPPAEETTTEVIPETEKPDNDVFPEDLTVTETPSLKILTPSPTKPHPPPPKRRPVKIRVHQKPPSKAASSFLPSTGSSSSSSDSSFLIDPSRSSSSSSSASSPRVQESAASRKDYVASTYPEAKNMYDTVDVPHAKPSTVIEKEASSQQTDMPSAGRASSSAGRTSGSGVPSRYGYGRRQSGNSFRGNSTRLLNGYKPAVTSPLNSPARTESLTSQDTSTDRSQNQETSDTFNPTSRSTPGRTSNRQTGSHSNNHDNSQSTSDSRSTSNRGSQATSHNTRNTQDSHRSSEQDTSYTEENHYSNHKDAGADTTKVDEPTSSSRTQPTAEEEITEEEDRKDSTNDKPVVPRTRLNPAFAERFPWLASRYPGRFGSNTRTSSSRQDGRAPVSRVSSSVGAGRPVLRGTPTRLSGATGAAGVSFVQETSEDLRTPSTQDSLKNGAGESSVKPFVTNQNTALSDSRNPTTSLSSHPSSTSSNSQRSSSGSRDSREPIHRRISSEDHSQEYLDQRNGETSGRINKVEDPTADQKNPVPSSDPQRNAGDNDSVDVKETPLRTRPSAPFVPTQRRPGLGVNGRVRSPVVANRQVGGSRLPMRPQPAQNSRPDSSTSNSSPSSSDSSSSSTSPQSVLTPDHAVGSGTSVSRTGGLNGGNSQSSSSSSSSSSSRDSLRNNGLRPRYPIVRGKPINGKVSLGNTLSPQVVDLELGVLMNQDGQVLQDSQGQPKRVVLGEDGRTIFDHMGSPLVNQEGMALFGHGRDSQPVVNPKEKVLMVGGKPVVGLNPPRSRIPIKTTTKAPTTTPEPTTTEWPTEEITTPLPFPTCPPGTFSKTDEFGYPVLDPEGILDCYPEGKRRDIKVTVFFLLPAPYVNYIQKDPGAPCSLTEALEYLQVDVLENLIGKESTAANQNQPPKNKPHNLTVVAMEGCHSFIILDWAQPLKDDMVSGYLVHSASYDDVLNNRWSSQSSSGTHLAVENLKPNSRYYFKVQAKNVFGLGPFSETLTYSLLLARPSFLSSSASTLLSGGEPIWIPFSFKYNSAHSSCKGSQYVKRTWYRKFVGVVLCNSLRYKIFMGDGLRDPFYSIGDTFGQGEDHCQFVDSYRDGRTGPAYLSNYVPSAQGFYRAYRQEPVSFGVIGRRTAHPFVGWYECGVPIPGKW
uniref:Fibronectin type III domain containing 1 n=1 Tax=Salarias fasciatus TaxID=181472 RepID=A0A672GSQ8_SALFA